MQSFSDHFSQCNFFFFSWLISVHPLNNLHIIGSNEYKTHIEVLDYFISFKIHSFHGFFLLLLLLQITSLLAAVPANSETICFCIEAQPQIRQAFANCHCHHGAHGALVQALEDVPFTCSLPLCHPLGSAWEFCALPVRITCWKQHSCQI